MKKTFFTLAFTLLGICGAIAQTQVGLRAGFNIATTTNSNTINGDELDDPWKPGLVLGLATSFHAGENFAVAPEFNYVQKGLLLEGTSAGLFNEDYKVNLNYIEVPLLFRVHFGDVLGGYINAGPTFSYLISGKRELDGDDDDAFEVEDAGFNRFELGGAIGGGVALNTELGTFLIDLRYSHAFSKLYDTDQDDFSNAFPFSNDAKDARNQMISTSLIYLIPSLR
jgi:hypothetical protein